MKACIVDAVRDQPGIHFRGLQREVGCSTNTLNHHLRRVDAVDEERFRGYRRLYPEETPAMLRNPLAALNHGTRGPVLHSIAQEPGITVNVLADRVEKAPSTVSGHLAVLHEADLVTVKQEGRRKAHHPTRATERAVRGYADRLLDKAADSFIAMWE